MKRDDKLKTLKIQLLSNSYNIYIKNGLLKNVPEILQREFEFDKLVIITDENVDKLYAKEFIKNCMKLDIKTYKITIEAGEQSKNFDKASQIYDFLIEHNINKADMIVSLGGGVVGDLSGFVSSTYLRGIRFVQIPTTLLAQVDSSVGGKTAINVSQGKNLIGTFYHPKAVYIDPDVLETLDEKCISDGMAEVIKYGCIKDRDLFNKIKHAGNFRNLKSELNSVITRCIEIKKDVVQEDEKESSIRMILNFGHTIGHAIEKYYNYNKYTHGEGVAIGMYKITQASVRMKKTAENALVQLKDVLVGYGLPHTIENINEEEICSTIKLDKKSRGSKINLILLKDIGECFIETIENTELKKYI